MVSKSASSFRPVGGRLFLHGIYVERGAADLFRRARKRRRRSTQDGEQSGRSGDRRRSALPARLFPAGNRRARAAAGPLSIQRSRPTAHQPLRETNGEWLRLRIDFPGGKLWIRTWQVQVGRTKLYLLDTNDPANIPAYRGITSELYGGGPELRLKQELVLGIGGWRLLQGPRLAAGGLPSQRRPCGVRGAGTSPLLHGG